MVALNKTLLNLALRLAGEAVDKCPKQVPNPELRQCKDALREQHKPTPKACANCGNGPCWFPLP